MLKSHKKIIILGILLAVIVILLLGAVLFFKKETPAQKTSSVKEEEIKKIQALVQRAQETGEKEPLIRITKDGFSQEEIKIKPNTFISFYNTTDKDVTLEAKNFKEPQIIKTGIVLSIKFQEETEVKSGDRILKISFK